MKDILAAMICIIIFAMGFLAGAMFNRYETLKTGREIIRTDRLTGSVEVAVYSNDAGTQRYDNFMPIGDTPASSND